MKKTMSCVYRLSNAVFDKSARLRVRNYSRAIFSTNQDVFCFRQIREFLEKIPYPFSLHDGRGGCILGHGKEERKQDRGRNNCEGQGV